MTTIGIVGAGAGAAATAHVLDSAVPDASVTVLEKSGGVCGRAATRRHEALTYEYGANYLKDDDERVTELVTETLSTDGLVDITEPVYTFDADGTVSPGRDDDGHKWTYRSGITQLAKRLFDGSDADVYRRTRVEHVERVGDQWHLVDTDSREWGPFDVLVLNPPAPQTATLVREAAWEADIRELLADAAEAVPYRSIWTAVLHYPFELDVPYYALVNPGKDHDVGWIAREECKPGHVPDGESLLVVQSSHEWSLAHYEDDPAENVRRLATHTADILDDERLTDPQWTDWQGWRYALPEDGVARGPLDSAAEHDLYCLGDWVAGEGRLHAALANGLETGERIAHSLS